MTNKPRIGIDTRLYGPGALGIGRYVKELVDVLLQDERFHYVLFLNQQAFRDFPAAKNVTPVLLEAPYYSLQEQWHMKMIISMDIFTWKR